MKALLFERDLHAEVAALARAHVGALVVLPVPLVGFDIQACARVLQFTNGCNASRSRAAVDRELLAARKAEQRAVEGVHGASLLDPENQLCSTDRCSTEVDGVDLYSDDTHLTFAGALRLTPSFVRAISAAGGRR